MVEFAGWEMPVQYQGIIAEHLAVRTKAGIFDVSHMGELEIRGSTAEETLQWVTCNDASRLSIGQCQYSALTTPKGTFVDDLLVYRLGKDQFILCVNAANQEKDYQWIRENARPNTEVHFRSDEFCQIAVQGPLAAEILRPLTELNLSSIKYYWFALSKFDGIDAIISRTGYTGEDGFEIYINPSFAETVWNRIMEVGQPRGLVPAGLAARNTLRLEAAMLLYGNDIDETTTILEADLGWICRLEKGDFIGRQELAKQYKDGVKRILVGFEVVERGIARDQYPIELDQQRLWKVTSGSVAPYLRKNIGLAYLPTDRKIVGTEFSIIIHGKSVKARIVPTPFYKRVRAA